MKAIVCDVRRALAGRWFWAALLATTAALYLSIGQAADALMDDFLADIARWNDENGPV